MLARPRYEMGAEQKSDTEEDNDEWRQEAVHRPEGERQEHQRAGPKQG